VSLFYGKSDRGVWALGSRLVLKERPNIQPILEAKNLRFISHNTTIPVPQVVEDWSEDNGRYFLITTRLEGVSLKEAWPTLSETQKSSIAKQTAQFINQLRQHSSNALQSLDSSPLYSAFLFRNGYGLPHGPFTSDEQLWEEMAKALKGATTDELHQLWQRMPTAEPYIFTHGDLTNANIIVKDGALVGIIDWEASGYFPVWWEFVATGIVEDEDDRAWKTLLRSYLQDFTTAEQFWLDYYRRSM
jgi:aminoglycoside phosphotransferase (APT) family kinase protein